MCDTIVAMPNSTASGRVLFGKNSDREPNEPHILIYVPACEHAQGEQVRLTYTEIPQVKHTNAVLLFKPSWLWGCEMGANEHGVVIGNEAVFTRFKKRKTGILGMDFIRLALERAASAREAKDVITSLLAQYGQGGNGGYRGTLYYDNSYLIADKTQAYILETAGRFWASKKVEDVGAISNCLTLGTDFDELSDGAAEYAMKKRWCKSVATFDFAKAFTEPVFTFFSKGRARVCQTREGLTQNKGALTPADFKRILRSHPAEMGDVPLAKNSMAGVCMHAGGLVSDQTTGSLIAELGDKTKFWATAASTPCFSMYKPVEFAPTAPVFTEHERDSAVEVWTQRERLLRTALAGRLDLVAYTQARDALENEIESLPADKAFERETQFVREAGERFASNGAPLGNARYRAYWKKQNKDLQR